MHHMLLSFHPQTYKLLFSVNNYVILNLYFVYLKPQAESSKEIDIIYEVFIPITNVVVDGGHSWIFLWGASSFLLKKIHVIYAIYKKSWKK